MKIKENFILRNVAGSFVVVPTGKATVDFSGMITLNETGVFLWKQLETDQTKDELVSALLKEYDVDETTAQNDIEAFLKILEENNLLIK
ncbi:MAG: PqqD family protein [Planctomycetia bacterium]|nr:PqqD family protein [Planctomycetia bacterium]